MSDVPITKKKLECLVCGWPSRSAAALQWHGMSMHGDAGRSKPPRRPQPLHDGGHHGRGNHCRNIGDGHQGAAAADTIVGHKNGDDVAAVHYGGNDSSGDAVDSVRPPAAPSTVPPSGRDVNQENDAVSDAKYDATDGDADDSLALAGVPAEPTKEAASGVDDDLRKKDKDWDAIRSHLESLLALTRVEKGAPASKKLKTNGGISTASMYDYTTIATYIRTLYEEIKDWQRSEPLISERKRARPGLFNTYRLQALQRFVLRTGRGGLSLREQEDLFDLLDVWDGTRPGMPMDDGHDRALRKTFNSSYAFQCAIRDDLDAAVMGAGWKTCSLEEGGVAYVAIFRSAMDVLLAELRSGKRVRFWSGGDKPGDPTAMRETPMDGDAFRSNEEVVIGENPTKPGAFLMGVHVYSDSSLLSWSGGTSESDGVVDGQCGEKEECVASSLAMSCRQECISLGCRRLSLWPKVVVSGTIVAVVLLSVV